MRETKGAMRADARATCVTVTLVYSYSSTNQPTLRRRIVNKTAASALYLKISFIHFAFLGTPFAISRLIVNGKVQ